MSERWFLALWPDSETRTALEAQLVGLIPFQGRATHPLDRHLTLVFLGELDPDRLGGVESVASQVSAPRFELELDRIGHFARSQILWCGPSRTPEPLTALVADLQIRLAARGIATDPRPYRPHLTLARRVRQGASLDLPAPVPWPVTELVLAFGRSGAPPRYRIQRRWPLGRVGI
ncbi:RNA 2',3'-cyclic phosphodiesterase [Thiocystis violacea]|uniref:RNA 2',3'-cyclic phosphodiesterase n=1 Tax=Thiocystis violacea TaxID=13725 RepID=UPI0019084E8B|nr:RNA 2',3'-cyclic phosphodiesterase [Thiocystis violacea]MBK1717596.1 RNA 2',3'-cyclic phosphodiesterase [Thiocystis violacea]